MRIFATADAGQLEKLRALEESFYRDHFALWGQLAAPAGAGAIPAAKADTRFAAAEWQLPFFQYVQQAYLLNSKFLLELGQLADLEPHAKRRLQFQLRQLSDAMAPNNYAATNPEVIKLATQTGGGESCTRHETAGGRRRPRAYFHDRRTGVRGRSQPGGDAGRGGVRKRSDAADPVRAGDRERLRIPAAAGAAVHQQVLHPRPAAGKLLRALLHRAGLQHLHRVMAKHSARTRATRLGRLYRARHIRPDRGDQGDLRQRKGQRTGFLRRRHPAFLRARG